MKRQSYLGSSAGSAQEELRRTIHRSRRLALKRRRERRRSVGEALGLTPGRGTHHRGNNLRQDAAEQLTLSIATRDQQRGNERGASPCLSPVSPKTLYFDPSERPNALCSKYSDVQRTECPKNAQFLILIFCQQLQSSKNYEYEY